MAKILIVSGVFVTALAVLVWVGVVEASIPVLKVTQLGCADFAGGTVKLSEGKVASIENFYPLKMTIVARDDPSMTLQVESTASPPENLKIGIDVGLVGEYSREKKVFRAYKVSTQCPSKYEATKDGASKDKGPASGYPMEPQSTRPLPTEQVKS